MVFAGRLISRAYTMPCPCASFTSTGVEDSVTHAFFPHSEQQPAQIRHTSIEVVWPVTASLG
ncbi:hypothetical protein AVEN_178473-1, partial [Araneus ventricosus]